MTFLNQKSINLPIVAMGVVCFLYLLPYYILGTDSHIMIWDNLDSNVAIFKVLSDSGKIFSPNTTHLLQIFNGIDRGLLPSELNCTTLLYNIFSPYTAYVIDRTLMTIIGFTGMYLLVSKNVIKSDNEKWIAAGVACGFAVLPFWPPSSLSD